jgi:serine/threonine-protein kinase
MGTPNYMAPEQATGMLEEIDHRTDQWALACIAWEMLLGRGPFVADETAALLYQIINLDPHPLAPRVPGLPPAVETALRRALRKKPAERFSSMREFSRELESAAFGRPADVTPAPVLVSSIAPPTSPTIGYSATLTPLTPVRQPAAQQPRDARKADSDRATPENGSSPIHAIVEHAKELARSATGQLSRIKPIYPVVAGAGVLLLLGAFLLLRSSPTPKTAVTSPAPPVVTPLPQPPEPPVVTAEPTEAKPAQATPTSARPKRQKWVDPFTSGDFDKPAKTTTPAPPRHKAKRKMFQEL